MRKKKVTIDKRITNINTIQHVVFNYSDGPPPHHVVRDELARLRGDDLPSKLAIKATVSKERDIADLLNTDDARLSFPLTIRINDERDL